MSKERSLKDYGLITAKGLGMGAADAVPGVSGGTIAFISGIYEELLSTIANVNLRALKVLRTGGIKAFWKHVNGNFLVALLLGVGIGLIGLAKVVNYFLEFHQTTLWSFFFGLVIASFIYVAKQVKQWRWQELLGLILGGTVAYAITIMPPIAGGSGHLFIFFSGFIAICAMILPGISGSFILLLLGAYKPVLSAIDSSDFGLLGVFGAGCIAGLLTFSHVLKWLFSKFESLVIAILSGFLLGLSLIHI